MIRVAIGSIGNSFLNTITDQQSAREKVEQIKFEDILQKTQGANAEESDQALEEACGEFEAYFLNKVFSEMRKSIPDGGLFEEDKGKEIYEDMLYDSYTKEIAKGTGAGIKDMLYRQLKKTE